MFHLKRDFWFFLILFSWYYFQFVFIYLLILEMIIIWIVDVVKPRGWCWRFSCYLRVLCYFVSFLLLWVFARYLFVCVNHFSSFIWLGFAHFLVFFFFWKLIELKYDIRVYHLWFSLFWISFGLQFSLYFNDFLKYFLLILKWKLKATYV